MDAKMANFIGIHMMSDIVDAGSQVQGTDEDLQNINLIDGQYQDPVTGCHFEYNDLIKRLKILQRRRVIIDQAIEEEIMMQ